MTTEKPKSLTDALRLFQMKVKAAPKSGFTKFPNPREYSKLEDVLQIVQYAHELGISHTQTGKYIITEQGEVIDLLITTLYFGDEKLESIDRLPPLPTGKNTSQEDGIRRTYLKKYALSAIYGIGSDDDDDANSLTPPPEKEKGTDRSRTKPNQKLEPVSEQAKKNPPITTEARNLIQDELKELNKTNPDKAKEIAASFIKEFKVPRVTGFITEARHGEFLSHAISKLND
jgi:hypothetical protein|tara:strand:+ start:59 stop:748 length:690 start_codon:yes stop_codon:yes gene_type:complete